jgi:hypothetical protein
MTFMVMVWVVLGVATLALAAYRKMLASQEEDVVRLGAGEEKEIPRQVELARKLSSIDRWGKTLTVFIAVIGLGLASAYLYSALQNPNNGPNNFYRMNSPAK